MLLEIIPSMTLLRLPTGALNAEDHTFAGEDAVHLYRCWDRVCGEQICR